MDALRAFIASRRMRAFRPTAQLVALYIITKVGSRQAVPSNAVIATEMQMAKRSVSQALIDLESAGVIARQRDGRGRTYRTRWVEQGIAEHLPPPQSVGTLER